MPSIQFMQICYKTQNPLTITTDTATATSTDSTGRNHLTLPWDRTNEACHQDLISCRNTYVTFFHVYAFVQATLGCSFGFVFVAILHPFIGLEWRPTSHGFSQDSRGFGLDKGVHHGKDTTLFEG